MLFAYELNYPLLAKEVKENKHGQMAPECEFVTADVDHVMIETAKKKMP
ncbi:hypothetical protein [Lederbergia ruris]